MKNLFTLTISCFFLGSTLGQDVATVKNSLTPTDESVKISYFTGSWENLKAEAKRLNKPYFVDFYADWSPPSKEMNNTTFADEAIIEFVNKNYLAYKLNGEEGEGLSIANKMNIIYYPTIHFYNEKGEKQEELIGYQNADSFLATLEKHASKDAQKEFDSEGIQFFHGSWDDLVYTAKKMDKPFFIDFYADWCGPCKVMDKKTFTNPTVGKYANEHFVPVRLNAEEKEGLALAGKYKVSTYPTVAFFDARGRLISKEEGYRDANDFLALLQKYTRITAVEQVGIEFFQGSWDELLAQAKKDGKPFFVDFYTDWCGPCKAMSKNTFTDAAVGEFANRNFISYKMNAEKGEGTQISAKYGVGAYPSIFFFNKDGKLIGKEVGYQDSDRFLYTLEKYAKKAGKK